MADTNGHVANGEGGKKEKKKANQPKPALEREVEYTSPDVSQSPFIRALGSTDFNTRAKGVQALTRFLQLKSDLAEEDLLKIWKGLYVCFWHSDKAPVQEDLADRLVGIFPALNQRMAYSYFTIFIQTMQREWFNIDRLRLDKFLMLVRKFMGQLFAYLRSHNWDPHLLEQYTDFLRDHLLLPLNPHHAVGLAYHVCDIFVPELRAALAAAPTHNTTHPSHHHYHHHQQQQQAQKSEVGVGKKRGRQAMQDQQQQQQQEAAGAGGLPAAALEALLEPFSSALLRAGEQAMLTRVREAVFGPLIEELLEEDGGQDDESVVEEGSEGQDGAGRQQRAPLLVLAGGEGLGASFAAQLFEMGGMPEVKARNRTVLFGISQSLEKAQRKRAKRMLPDIATIPSPTSPTVSLPRHQQQQQQQQQQQKQRAQEQQQQKQQQQQQLKGPGSSTKKAKKDKALVFLTDADEQQAKQQQQQQQQDGPDLDAQLSEPSLMSPAAASVVSPKSLKKQRKAEAAAAAAAAWGEGGIGSRSAEASPTFIPGTSAPPSYVKKQGKKGQVDEASVHAAESSPTFILGTSAPPTSAKKQGKKARQVDPETAHVAPAYTPAAAASGTSAAGGAGDFAFSAAVTAGEPGGFAFSAAGPSEQGVSGESSPSTPTLGKSAVKKDKKRKAEVAGDDGADLWGGMDSIDAFAEAASASKSALKSTGAKGRVSIPTADGVDDGDGSQRPVLRSSVKKHKKQLQQGGPEVEALGSPQEVLLQPSAPPKSALKSALKQQSTPTLKSALKHKGLAQSAADGVDLDAAGKEALKTAMRHRSLAADDVEMNHRSAQKAHKPAPHTSEAPEAAAPSSFTTALQVRLAQEAGATTTPMPSPGLGKRTHMQHQQQQQQQLQQSQEPGSTPQGVGASAAQTQGAEKSSSGKKRRAAAAAGGPATSARKAVRINLRNNLYFEHGGPIPDPMVRTPPTARSKGSILKRAQESLAAMGIPSTPKSAPAKLEKQQQLQAKQQQQPGSIGKNKHLKSAHVTPIKSPRAKAELFF